MQVPKVQIDLKRELDTRSMYKSDSCNCNSPTWNFKFSAIHSNFISSIYFLNRIQLYFCIYILYWLILSVVYIMFIPYYTSKYIKTRVNWTNIMFWTWILDLWTLGSSWPSNPTAHACAEHVVANHKHVKIACYKAYEC